MPSALPTTMIPKQVLLNLVSAMTGVQARWRHDPEFVAGMQPGNASLRAWVWLSVLTQRAIGQDNYLQQLNTQTGNLDSMVRGDRIFTLSCRCESYDRNVESVDLAEALRIRLRTYAAHTIFAPALALVDIGPIATFANVVTDAGTKRTLKVSVIDVRFSYVSTYVPTPADDPGGVISTVDGGQLGVRPPSPLVP